MKFIKIRYSDEYGFAEIYDWCKNNCKNNFYSGYDWENWISGQLNRIIEFTNEKDAVLFSLKFGEQNVCAITK